MILILIFIFNTESVMSIVLVNHCLAVVKFAFNFVVNCKFKKILDKKLKSFVARDECTQKLG